MSNFHDNPSTLSLTGEYGTDTDRERVFALAAAGGVGLPVRALVLVVAPGSRTPWPLNAIADGLEPVSTITASIEDGDCVVTLTGEARVGGERFDSFTAPGVIDIGSANWGEPLSAAGAALDPLARNVWRHHHTLAGLEELTALSPATLAVVAHALGTWQSFGGTKVEDMSAGELAWMGSCVESAGAVRVRSALDERVWRSFTGVERAVKVAREHAN